MSIQDIVIQVASSTFASFAFSMVFHTRGINTLISSLGVGLGWLVYCLLSYAFPSDLIRYLAAGFIISVYCELMARIRKSPVTVFLVVAIIPLVPGGGAYHTMEYLILGQTSLAASTGIHTLAIAGCIAVGIFTASSLIRLIPLMPPKYRLHKIKK